MFPVRLRHRDKIASCIFFVVLGEGQALLGMPDAELLDLLKITCELVRDQQGDRKVDAQTKQPSNSPSCKANEGQQIKTDNVDIHDGNANIPDYFRSNINRAADKSASQVFLQKYTMNSVMFFQVASLAYR